jgi:hypothetical protein
MRNRLLALAVTGLAFGAWAAPAVADEPVSSQSAEQVAGSHQQASSNANSTQIGPSNQNISVRVLSPGDNGSVTQSNESQADSFAGNHNSTDQSVDQSQSGSGATALQEALQKAGSEQKADSEATSTQVKPKNQNISVRVLSPGDDGAVEQSNSSKAESKAVNGNETDQDVDQKQGSGSKEHGSDEHGSDEHGHDCGCDDATGIQAAGQEAYNEQKADSSATSTQIKPSNQNISVRVLSPGDDGSVSQSNESAAYSKALNHNETDQDIDQSQAGSSCGCHGATAIQAAAQAAYNRQKAESAAESKQVHPENGSLSFRLKSHGGGGDLTQSNSSLAASFAATWNSTEQDVDQSQGGHRK